MRKGKSRSRTSLLAEPCIHTLATSYPPSLFDGPTHQSLCKLRPLVTTNDLQVFASLAVLTDAYVTFALIAPWKKALTRHALANSLSGVTDVLLEHLPNSSTATN